MSNDEQQLRQRQIAGLSRVGESRLITSATRRGHGSRTRFAAVGAGAGAAIGSFGGPVGALIGGALGGWLGSLHGDEQDANAGQAGR